MTLIAIPEHGWLWRGTGNPAPNDTDRAVVPPVRFERLRRLDERLGQGNTRAFEWFGDRARARQYVGVMQVAGLVVEILPKITPAIDGGQHFARRNLLHMLQLAGDVPTRERGMASQDARKGPLSETLMAIFARRLLGELSLGRDQRYQVRQRNERALKGKLLFGPHLRVNAVHRERFFVEHAELSSDTPLNQALKAACRLLLGAARLPDTQEALRRCLLCLQGVTDTIPTAQTLDRITVTRRSARFEPLLNFCRLVLGQRAPTATAGQDQSFALLFDMNVVFERYISAFIRRHVMPTFPWHTVHLHARHHWRYLLHARDDARGVLRLEPDMLISRTHSPDERVMTLDTKWKRLDQSGKRRGVAREDLYQLFAYAQRYGCPHNVLLYPKVQGSRSEDYVIPGRNRQDSGAICARFVDLDRDLQRDRAALTDELRHTLSEFIEERWEPGDVLEI